MGAFLNKKLGKVLLAVLVAAVPFSVDAASIVRAPNNLGLVGYWSFDDGVGTQVGDLSGNGLNGTLQGAPEWRAGHVMGALGLDGVGDYVNFGQVIDWNSQSYTVSIWFKLDSLTSLGDSTNNKFRIFYGGGTYDFLDIFQDGGNFRFQAETSTNNQYWNLGNSGVPADTEWHMLTMVFGGGEVSGYMDGDYFGVVDTSATTQRININSLGRGHLGGEWGHSYGDYFLGAFDEFRIYSRALSNIEIQSIYQSSKRTVVGVSSDKYNDGLVAHYTFDGSTISGTTVQDVAGGNNGAINGTVTPVIGRIGQGVSFLGASAHYIAVPHSTDFDVTELTLATWIKTPPTMNCGSSCYRALFSKQDGGTRDYNLYTHTSDGDTVTRLHFSSSTFGSHAHNLPTALEPNTWHHVAVTVASNGFTTYYIDGTSFATSSGSAGNANGNYPLWIGRADNSWNGLMDDVRVYNRALSPEEIRGLAGSSIATLHSSSDNLVTGGLVGHWTFDSGTLGGGTAQDVSGGGHHLTTHGSSSASGVLNQAASFNGSSNYTQVSYAPELNPSSFSVSLWARVDGGAGGYRSAITSRDSSPQSGYIIYAGNNNKWQFWIGDGSNWQTMSGGDVEIGEWVHIVATYGSGAMSLYENGILVATANRPFLQNTDEPLRIGAGSNGLPPQYYFNGLIDDVRVYNRVIAPHEIQTLYSMGQ